MKMVVCRFFLQGNCKFGDQCKFEHQLNDNYSNTSILRQPNPTASVNTNNTLIETIVADMLKAENGNQWLLSCYSPFKETQCFPGFEEQSFEEVRWGYYEAEKNGTKDQFCQQLQMVLQKTIMQIRRLQNPTPDIVNFITNLYPSQSQSQYTNSQNQNSKAESIFATANKNLFGRQQTNSIFSNNPLIRQQLQSIPERPEGFSETQQTQFPMNSQNSSPFFSTETRSNIQQENVSPFFKPEAANIPPQNVTSTFENSITPQVTQQSVFNNVFSHNTQILNQKRIPQDDSCYSKLEDLNELDIKIFQSGSFQFGNIPEKPPTRDMCL